MNLSACEEHKMDREELQSKEGQANFLWCIYVRF